MSQVETVQAFSPKQYAAMKPDADAPAWAWAMWRGMGAALIHMQHEMRRMVAASNTEVSFGNPHNNADLTAPESIRDNINGQWVTVSITNSNQLGAGAASPIVFTHGLNHPVNVGGGVANPSLPNVIWGFMRVSHGLKAAPGANPAAAANPVHTSVHFLNGDAVTADAISLRIHSGLTPSVNDPIVVSLFFARAVV